MGEKLYIVKREVIAHSLKEALIKDGEVYEISIAEEKYQPLTSVKVEGFTSKKK